MNGTRIALVGLVAVPEAIVNRRGVVGSLPGLRPMRLKNAAKP